MMKKILITGGTGFLGSHLTTVLKDNNFDFRSIGSDIYDLTKIEACFDVLNDSRPDIVIHLAALSGGIGINRTEPEKFFHVNSLLVANMFKAVTDSGIKRMIYTMCGCSYPGNATSPINEKQMWEGYPQGESVAYSSAKKMGIVAAEAYRHLGLETSVLVPGNMYGEFDNYSLANSHVIAAMIRKYVEATENNQSEVKLWGSGKPVRDFVYAGDVAKIVAKVMLLDKLSGPVNISTSTSTSMSELAKIISEKCGFKGSTLWDATKPDGQMIKIFDNSYSKTLGLNCETSLEEGLGKTISWFRESRNLGGVRL